LIQALGYALAVLGILQKALVGWIAEEGNLGENRRHIRADQHYERCFADATVFYRFVQFLDALGQRFLNVGGKFARFVDLFAACDLPEE